jgi:DNA-directed RNA polymerase specialized sigma24 family protein
MSNDRIISEKQERAYRLCAGEFEGLATSEAAKLMGISVRAVQRLLERMEAAAPQLFPLLTKQEAQVLKYIEVDGLSQIDIADQMELSEPRVSQIVHSLIVKGKLRGPKQGRALSYDPGMDGHVREKF